MFEILPRLGLGPLRLGLSPAEATALLGAPVSSNMRGSKETRFFANDIAIAFEDGRGFRISIGRRAKGITFQGHDVFMEPTQDILDVFLRAAPAWEEVGMLVFPDLWLIVSGFHDDDPDQKAIGIESFADWPAGFEEARPFRLAD